jgi:hypothetical protein
LGGAFSVGAPPLRLSLPAMLKMALLRPAAHLAYSAAATILPCPLLN